MQSIHPVEAAWRRFRREHNLMDLLERSLERQKLWIRDGYRPRPEVVLPRAIALSVIDEVCPSLKDVSFIPKRFAELGDKSNSVLLSNSIAVWSAWRDSKRLYQVDPALAESLAHMRWPESAPAESLRLPARCAVLELPSAIKGKFPLASVYGGKRSWGGEFFEVFKKLTSGNRIASSLRALLPVAVHEPVLDQIGDPRRLPLTDVNQESTEALYVAASYEPLGPHPSDGLELIISRLIGSFWMAICCLKLVAGEDLRACARVTEESFRHIRDIPEEGRTHWADPNAKLAMVIFLYMAGDKDVVRLIHPGERPVRDTVRRHDPGRFKDLATPAIYTVGRSFGKTVEQWETEREPGTESEITGRGVRPHHRAAHYHQYWTGVGRLVRRWRFLLPVSVKGGRIPDETPNPLKHEVR